MFNNSIKHPVLFSITSACLILSMAACNVTQPQVSNSSLQTNQGLLWQPTQDSQSTEQFESGAAIQVSHSSSPTAKPPTPVLHASYQTQGNAAVTRHEPIGRLPAQAQTGGPVVPGAPYPAHWSPPQISYPWPEDEYVYQGGDSRQQVNVAQDFSIHNLDEEDAIVHYHTLDGKIAVQATNQLPIYAPRFASVRHISSASQYHHQDHASGVDNPLALARTQENLGSEQVLQRVQPGRNISNRKTALYRDQSKARDVEYRITSNEDSQRQKPQDGLLLNTRVRIQNSQEARLSKQNTTAITATDEETVRVYVKDFMPYKILGQAQIQATYHYEIPEGKSRLEIRKSSSSNSALPGDELAFTITFKNVGDQTVGNVTIVDHLSRRLVYLPDSQACDVQSNFLTSESIRESLILRWEITQPLEVGQSGSITFKCRVR